MTVFEDEVEEERRLDRVEVNARLVEEESSWGVCLGLRIP